MLGKFLRDEDGATAIEYGLIAAFIALAIIAAVGMTGEQLVALFESSYSRVDAVALQVCSLIAEARRETTSTRFQGPELEASSRPRMLQIISQLEFVMADDKKERDERLQQLGLRYTDYWPRCIHCGEPLRPSYVDGR